jgi:hypothetical protein
MDVTIALALPTSKVRCSRVIFGKDKDATDAAGVCDGVGGDFSHLLVRRAPTRVSQTCCRH